jgi:outer membrane receptor protein involved in Fe transport
LFDAQFSPKIGVVYHPGQNQSFRFTVNRAFLSPSALQLFLEFPVAAPIDLRQLEAGMRASPLGPALAGVPVGTLFTNSAAVPTMGIGNSKLKPEQVTGYELGYKGQVQKLYLTADAYYSTITNFGSGFAAGVNPEVARWTAPAAVPAQARTAVENAAIAAVGVGLSRLTDGSTAYALSLTNAGIAHTWGVELGGSLAVGTNLTLSANYTYSGIKLDQTTFIPGDTISSNTPTNAANIGATYEWNDGLRLRAGLRMTDAYHWRSFPWNGDVPSMQNVDLTASYPFGENWDASFVGTNVFDQRRFQIYGGSVVGRRLLAMVTWHR